MWCGVITMDDSAAHTGPPPALEHRVPPHLDPAYCFLGLHHSHIFGGSFVWEQLGGAKVISSKNDSINQVLRVTRSRNCNTQTVVVSEAMCAPHHAPSPLLQASNTAGQLSIPLSRYIYWQSKASLWSPFTMSSFSNRRENSSWEECTSPRPFTIRNNVNIYLNMKYKIHW